jgi:hypothetical protein
MRTTPDAPRRGLGRAAARLALVLALAHGTTGCAHQLTNAELATGALFVTAVVAGAFLAGTGHCNDLTTRCPPPEDRLGLLAPATRAPGGVPGRAAGR